MPPIERTWRGSNLTTTWNKPTSPQKSFSVELAVDWDFIEQHPPAPDSEEFTPWPLKETKGVAYDTQSFTVRNGVFDFPNNTVTFDIVFDDAHHPEEKFDGILHTVRRPNAEDDIESILGTIKVHENWLQGKSPEVYGPYSRYRAQVTLR